MQITRQNYEEVFLLYVDNELSPVQRAAVETFIRQNPDLGDELRMLQDAVLIPDLDVRFDAKVNLFKKEDGINLANYEEYFLLYTDNELNKEEKDKVEKFVLQHPAIQQAFSLLQLTRLEAETITFDYKDDLYRSEEERILPVYWMRIAAAAAIIAFVALLYTVIPRNNIGDVNNTAVVNSQVEVRTPAVEAKSDTVEEQMAVTKETAPAINPQIAAAKEKVASESIPLPAKPTINAAGSNVLAVKEDNANRQRTNNLPQRVVDTDLAVNLPELDSEPNGALASKINRRNPGSNTISEDNLAAFTQADKPDESSDEFKQAVYRELDTYNEEENSFLIGSARINKNKLRGLLKKATNFLDIRIEKNTDDR